MKSIVVVFAALLASCAAPRVQPSSKLSFDVMAAATPVECCPQCSGLKLSVRNPGDVPVAIEWTKSVMRVNGEAVHLVVDGETTNDGDRVVSRIEPHTTYEALLKPQPGAPNPSALEEGRFRNGHYSVQLAVVSAENHKGWATADVDVAYRQDDVAQSACTAPAIMSGRAAP